MNHSLTIKNYLTRRIPLLRDTALVLFASILISLSGFIKIPLGFTPVPFVIQVQVVLFASLLLGKKRGALATLLFLFQGLLGFPVFSGGSSGWTYMLGATGGYLFGYLVAAYATPALYTAFRRKSFSAVFFSSVLGNLIIYTFGALWLSRFVGLNQALSLGVMPFILGDLVKITLTTGFYSNLKAMKLFSS
ncbi:MAG: biotin transporter BioY [Simkaniaceae bacterium]